MVILADYYCEQTTFMKEFKFLYGSGLSRNGFQVVQSVLFPFLLAQMLIIVNLGVNVHDDDQMVLGLVFYGNADNVLSMDVDDVFDYLGLIFELIGPDGFLFVGFNVLEDDGST